MSALVATCSRWRRRRQHGRRRCWRKRCRRWQELASILRLSHFESTHGLPPMIQPGWVQTAPSRRTRNALPPAQSLARSPVCLPAMPDRQSPAGYRSAARTIRPHDGCRRVSPIDGYYLNRSLCSSWALRIPAKYVVTTLTHETWSFALVFAIQSIRLETARRYRTVDQFVDRDAFRSSGGTIAKE